VVQERRRPDLLLEADGPRRERPAVDGQRAAEGLPGADADAASVRERGVTGAPPDLLRSPPDRDGERRRVEVRARRGHVGDGPERPFHRRVLDDERLVEIEENGEGSQPSGVGIPHGGRSLAAPRSRGQAGEQGA
jgi:hypothetical protein